MNKIELISKMNSFTGERISVGMELINKSNKNYSFLKCNIDDEVQKDIFNLLKSSIMSIINGNELIEFNPIGKADCTIEKLKVPDVEGLVNIINMRRDKSNFTTSFEDLREINAYILEVKMGDENLKIFRRYSKSKSLSKGMFLKVFSEQFTKLKENIFQIDNIVDFIVINDELIIIFNRYAFEVITNYKDNYFLNLDTALEEISRSNLINNIEQFEEDCKESTKIAKQFTKAMQDNSINLILENIQEVSDAIREAELPIEFINNKFQYESKEQLSILVALLSDKYAKTLIGKRITSN
ncbi:Kiwa anti-phage protein KwaB-like domain-containing protein [Clostridium nigeriense]|uniref:Kiwa anti-phage protein KwaB-like domain-containing protein n=1 Tax=Clostridium nigeriense TaxID=1805470 RepID=UPI000830C35D|nr:Kiwa anti-phage protein KwaB-like domain-containing protein [Clostridium nigeriense]